MPIISSDLIAKTLMNRHLWLIMNYCLNDYCDKNIIDLSYEFVILYK